MKYTTYRIHSTIDYNNNNLYVITSIYCTVNSSQRWEKYVVLRRPYNIFLKYNLNGLIMWSTRYEMSRDDCRKCLRCLELDAYGSMVSVLRAQGPFTDEKQKLLQELAKVLHITNERHRAEIRRAVNDEKLAAIAEQLNGPNTGTDWAIEGRRIIPTLPKLKARTAYTTLANSISLTTEIANEKKPIIKEVNDTKEKKEECQIEIKLLDQGLQNNSIENSKGFIEHMGKLPTQEGNSRNSEECTKINETDNRTSKIKLLNRKRKCKSPLLVVPPSKVLVVSSNSTEILNDNTFDYKQSKIQHSESIDNNLVQQNTIPKSHSINARLQSTEMQVSNSSDKILENLITDKSVIAGLNNTVEENGKLFDSSRVESSTEIENNINLTKSKVEISNNLLTVIKPKVETVNTSTESSVIQPILSTPLAKSIMQDNTSRVEMNPTTTVSNGPGPLQVITTAAMLVNKKLPAVTINHQVPGKLNISLNSNKTVNISHPNSKLTSKTNVIVIQKGSAKGVTLSHAGKEVLGKVIMGGKNLCLTNPQSTNSLNLLPCVALSNGDQAMTIVSANNQNTEGKSSIKPGNTIVFNVRQDVLKKNEIFSQLLKPSSTNISTESKTVIQNSILSPEEISSDLNKIGKAVPVKTDVSMEETNCREVKGDYSQLSSTVKPTSFMESKEILKGIANSVRD
ncbi:BRCA2-interacting transcriptional repressor EMSY isoform X2 [Prorops nasuta]|uniref:BRCA2-interacting transcriptional repressor EMSY isoform X2 n=1 Tax=Prorops nasuta TaxID=863751 RepID=UPI0034CE87BD